MEIRWISIAIIALLIVILVVFLLKKDNKKNKLTPLTGISFSFIIAGIVFGDNKILAYSLIGAGVVLAIIDVVLKLRKGGKNSEK